MQLGLSHALVAAAFTAAAISFASAGQPNVHVDTDAANQAAHVRASIDIAAPPPVLWSVITDCARQPQIVPTSYDGMHRMLFKRVDGDMRISEGEWRVEPAGRGSRLYYTALVAPKMAVPQFMVEHSINTDLPNVLHAIERASEADAARLPRVQAKAD